MKAVPGRRKAKLQFQQDVLLNLTAKVEAHIGTHITQLNTFLLHLCFCIRTDEYSDGNGPPTFGDYCGARAQEGDIPFLGQEALRNDLALFQSKPPSFLLHSICMLQVRSHLLFQRAVKGAP